MALYNSWCSNFLTSRICWKRSYNCSLFMISFPNMAVVGRWPGLRFSSSAIKDKNYYNVIYFSHRYRKIRPNISKVQHLNISQQLRKISFHRPPNRNITYMQYQKYIAKSIFNAHALYIWEYNIDYLLSTTWAKEQGQPKCCSIQLFEHFIHLLYFFG